MSNIRDYARSFAVDFFSKASKYLPLAWLTGIALLYAGALPTYRLQAQDNQYASSDDARKTVKINVLGNQGYCERAIFLHDATVTATSISGAYAATARYDPQNKLYVINYELGDTIIISVSRPGFVPQSRLFTTVRNNVAPTIKISLGQPGDEYYFHNGAKIPYTPRRDMICVVPNLHNRSDSVRFERLCSYMLLVRDDRHESIDSPPFNCKTPITLFKEKPLSQHNIFVFMKKNGADFDSICCDEIRRLRSSELVGFVGHIIRYGKYDIFAHDHRFKIYTGKYADHDAIVRMVKAKGARLIRTERNGDFVIFTAETDGSSNAAVTAVIDKILLTGKVLHIDSNILALDTYAK